MKTLIIELKVPDETDPYALKGSIEESWNVKVVSIKPKPEGSKEDMSNHTHKYYTVVTISGGAFGRCDCGREWL